MADKILRPITDVEIVEQMTENDTVLIEQNGAIKRTKGVVGGGGGKKYIIDLAPPMGDGEGPSLEWRTEAIEFDSFANMIKNSELPDILLCVDMIGVTGAVEKMLSCQFVDPDMNAIGMVFVTCSLIYASDGSLSMPNG